MFFNRLINRLVNYWLRLFGKFKAIRMYNIWILYTIKKSFFMYPLFLDWYLWNVYKEGETTLICEKNQMSFHKIIILQILN